MLRLALKISLLSLMLAASFPLPASAIPAITCHCFTDRSYDPAHPTVADPYFLAMTQNSFLASVFNIEKKGIVMMKQKGTSSDDLWIAYWVASKAGGSPETFLKAKQSKDSWKEVLAQQRVNSKGFGSKFTAELNAKAPASRLAERVVDELLGRYELLKEAELAAMRKSGASNQEVIISAVLAARTRQPAKHLYASVKSGAKSWGSIMQGARIEPSEMQGEISALLKAHH